jgi:hypothetical protein
MHHCRCCFHWQAACNASKDGERLTERSAPNGITPASRSAERETLGAERIGGI